MQSFILETVLTFFLILVILFTSQGSKEAGLMAGIAIGATVLLEAMFAGPISGASMNPARSMAPAIVSAPVSSLWVYLLAGAGSYYRNCCLAWIGGIGYYCSALNGISRVGFPVDNLAGTSPRIQLNAPT